MHSSLNAGRRHKTPGSKTKDSLFTHNNSISQIISICSHSRSLDSLRAMQRGMGDSYTEGRNPEFRELDSLLVGYEHVFPFPQKETLPFILRDS